jgi:A/G-specific adenine glycosylase
MPPGAILPGTFVGRTRRATRQNTKKSCSSCYRHRCLIERKGKVLITRRPLKGLLGGMWEFPGGKVLDGEDLNNCLHREIQEELGVNIHVREPFGVYRHAYTHYKVTLHAFLCALQNGDNPKPIQVEDIQWSSIPELTNFPMGKLDRQISKKLLDYSNDHR